MENREQEKSSNQRFKIQFLLDRCCFLNRWGCRLIGSVQKLFGPLASFFPRLRLNGDFEDAGEVLHHVQVVLQQIDRSFSSGIACGLVRARFDQQGRALTPAKKDSAVQGGVFSLIAVALVGVGPSFQKFGDRLGLSGVACPSQRGLPQEWILRIDIRLLCEEPVDFFKIAKGRGRPQAVGCFG